MSETSKPDADAIKAWAEGVKSAVDAAETKIERARKRIENATADLESAQTERVALNDDAALLGIPVYEPDDSAPQASTTRRDRAQLASDIVEALKANGERMGRKKIAETINEPTDKNSLERVTSVLTALSKNDPPLVKKDGAAQGTGAGWKYAG